MELTLNLIWLAIAATAFLLAPKRSGRVSWALICAAAILFPIVSVSDDLNADRTFNDAAAAVVAMVVLLVAFVAIARLRNLAAPAYVTDLATPSDPRSPPAR